MLFHIHFTSLKILKLQCFYEMVYEITKIKINAEKKHKVFV